MLKEGTGRWVGPQRDGVAWDVGHKHPRQGIGMGGGLTPQHPRDGRCALSLGCSGVPDTLLCLSFRSSPGGWRRPSPARGCGDKGPLRAGGLGASF